LPRSIEENHVWNIILQITDALKYCHYGPDGAAGPSSAWPVILHRDIKPGNS
jgi:serine/threonine protein kinase